MDAGESLLKLVNNFDEEVYMSGPITEWISGEFTFTFTCLFSCIRNFSAGFAQQCLSSAELNDAAASKAMLHETLNLPTPTPLLSEWEKATLAGRSWKGALIVAANVSISSYSGIPREINTLMVCSSHYPESQSIGSYVNVWMQSTV